MGECPNYIPPPGQSGTVWHLMSSKQDESQEISLTAGGIGATESSFLQPPTRLGQILAVQHVLQASCGEPHCDPGGQLSERPIVPRQFMILWDHEYGRLLVRLRSDLYGHLSNEPRYDVVPVRDVKSNNAVQPGISVIAIAATTVREHFPLIVSGERGTANFNLHAQVEVCVPIGPRVDPFYRANLTNLQVCPAQQ